MVSRGNARQAGDVDMSNRGLAAFLVLLIIVVIFLACVKINRCQQEKGELCNSIKQLEDQIDAQQLRLRNSRNELETLKTDRFITAPARKLGLRPTAAGQTVGNLKMSASSRKNRGNGSRLYQTSDDLLN